MLRANSEIAVAMSVASPEPNPISIARARPFWRACTMSWSELILTVITPSNTAALSIHLLELLVQVVQPFLQVQRCRNIFQRQPQLHHRKGNFRLNSNDYGLCATQADHLRNLAERSRGKRIHHVHRRDVDDDPSRAKPHHLLHQRTSQMVEVGVREGGLKGCNQHGSLFENGNFHLTLPLALASLCQCHHFVSQQTLRLLNSTL